MLSRSELERVARVLARGCGGARVQRVVQPGALDFALELAGGDAARGDESARVAARTAKSALQLAGEEADDESASQLASEDADGESASQLASEEADDESASQFASEEADDKSAPQLASEEADDESTLPLASEDAAREADARRRARMWVLLSCRPRTGRVSQLAKKPRAPDAPAGLAQYLKAHLEGARLREVSLATAERQLRLRFESPRGAAKTQSLTLLLSLFGARSNLYVLDARDCVVASARALATTRRDLSLGARWSDPEGAPPEPGADRFASAPDARLLTVIEAHYAALEAQEGARALAQAVARALGQRVKKLERKVRLLEQDCAAAADAPREKRFGELLKAQLGALKKGMREASVRDFESGASLAVPLDAALTPRENMERYFRRARRAEKRARRAEGEVDAARAALEEARARAAEAATASPARLQELASAPELARLLASRAEKTPASPARKKKVWKIGKRELPARLTPRRFASASGHEVWVGRSDEGNDLLTTRLARGRDLFFHLEGHAGSHVVLRRDGGEAPPEAVLDAAELALHFSKARRARVARVHVAAIRDVSKPRGAKPGLVYVHRGRSIELRRSEERLARLLAARVED